MGGREEEFPLLSALGLYASDIRGDGNCLFNALSDQLYGHQNEHQAVRSKVIAYMREHAFYYKQFIDVHPGGWVRRNPKRKNAGTYASPVNLAPPSQAEIDRVFESHLQNMAKGGTYGDNMEITAFSSAFDVNVKIYQRDFAYMVSGSEGSDDSRKSVAHIAYHSWEHYSSIRNLDGPHTGLPQVRLRSLSPEEERKQKEKLERTPNVLPWMIDIVAKSLPYLTDKITIKRSLEECKGNVNEAVARLLDAEERGSISSAQESSSVEREPDSDDEALNGPNKKPDCRFGRTRRVHMRTKNQQRLDMASKLAAHDASQSSFASASSIESRSALRSSVTPPESADISPPTCPDDDGDNDDDGVENSETEDSDWAPPSQSSTRASTPATFRTGPVRIKIHPPKPPDKEEKLQSQLRKQEQEEKSSRPEPIKSGRTAQKQPGPQNRRPTARERKDMKKTAQKLARKQRAQAEAAASRANNTTKLPIHTKEKDRHAPVIESGIKTLYI